MESRRRPTSNSGIARGLGGRSGFSGSEPAGETPEPAPSKAERVAAVRNWHDAVNHFEDYEDQNRFRLGRLVPSYELVIATAIVLVFVGGYAGFIAFLALTR
ncbi:MAG TPA: hypothetical protein VGV65_08990 [Nocardioides sp.]|nr:hypothetical protein [Nocardioides sp.]